MRQPHWCCEWARSRTDAVSMTWFRFWAGIAKRALTKCDIAYQSTRNATLMWSTQILLHIAINVESRKRPLQIGNHRKSESKMYFNFNVIIYLSSSASYSYIFRRWKRSVLINSKGMSRRDQSLKYAQYGFMKKLLVNSIHGCTELRH